MGSLHDPATAPQTAASPPLVATSSPTQASTSASASASASAPASASTAPAPAPAPAHVPVPAPLSPTSSSPPVQAQNTAQALAALAQQAAAPGPLPRPEDSASRQLTATASASTAAPAGPPSFFPQPLSSPPTRNDANSPVSSQATRVAQRSSETTNTSYSADHSPTLHQSIFSLKDGADVSNNRRTSRRRNGPLSRQGREKAALIRKLGACEDCKRRRVGCELTHHGMTWQEAYRKFNRSNSPGMQDIAPSVAAGRPLSPASGLSYHQPIFTHDAQGMDIDSSPVQHHDGRQSLSDSRRTPLPTGPSAGPRLEKSLSLPGIETLKNDLQSNAARMLSKPSRGRYTAVYALLLFWEDDDQKSTVQSAVKELAEVFENYYHYTLQVKTIPSSTDGSKSSWRWLSRELNAFAEHRDQRDVLKVVYYAGQTFLDGNREMVLASSQDSRNATIIRWNGIQQILEEASADTLIIMDAPYFPSAKMARQTGVLEVIAASMSDEHYVAIDRCGFTRALAELLRTRASRSSPLSAAEAHSFLFSNYPKMVRDRNPEQETIASFPAPLHIMMSGNSRLPSIFVAPLAPDSPHQTNIQDNDPTMQMTIRLKDDNVHLETWSEWLRLMPEGVRDVKVDGPFRPVYR